MDIRVMTGGFPHLRQHRRPLRIVVGAAACQNQPAVLVPLHQPVRVDHADRVLKAIEPGDLKEDRLVPGNTKALKRPVQLPLAEVTILLAQRVNRWVHQELWDVQTLGEPWQREDCRIIPRHMLSKEPPGLALRAREVDMAAPDPFPFPGAVLYQRRG